MNLAQVEAFLILADELHFGRTAERLALSQPRVSRLMTALEREVGGALFERTSRRVRLTPLGVRLRAGLQPGFAQIRAALDDARAAAGQPAGVLRIGFTNTTGGDALTSLVRWTQSVPRAFFDLLVPPQTPSGRPTRRTCLTNGLHETFALVASGRVVHPTVTPMPLAQRNDIVLVPIADLPALPLGLIWCTTHENSRIRAIAEVAATH